MIRIWRPLAFVGFLAAVGLPGVGGSARAQIPAQGGRTVIVTPAAPVVGEGPVVIKTRRRLRDRNPYFAARPVYPPAAPGARANITFEPFTRWYYPRENTYYPPVDRYPSIRSR